ncbi:hypothetical protein [Raineyella fluvialis]|uniref:Uncharacterized protein n=1 Tax=Raineyella fluvialis TaxID=2662261 RepID=A0A5Q2F7T2_9ACTN|nr:hypothetical protein [Raineyella fluvialis]QGF23040.1 hypothetical protein Rai3103_04460 [Raineyella fluvialis]
MPRNSGNVTSDTRHRGIVRKVDPEAEAKSGDLTFSPDYTVTSTDDKGGKVLADVEVILVFWGGFWSATPAPSPSRNEYEQAIQGIVTGPYLSGLNQYRGVGQGSVVYSEIFDGTSPSNGYTDADVVAMLKGRFANNTSMPKPASGHNRFYAVIAPQGVANSLSQFAGQHQSLTYNGATAYYAWVDNTGSLTGHDCVTKVFSHELVEALTNPDVDTSNNSILVQGTMSNGTTVTNDEIGDTCNNEFATVDMNGITCSVQSYWSKAADTCVLPLGSVDFWVDKDTFGRDEVADLIAASGGTVPNAFWLVVEGFSQTTFGSLNVSTPVPTGPFASIPGVTISANGAIDFENAAHPDEQQRIRVAFDITFDAAVLSQFPASGSQTYALDAFLATDGSKVASTDTSTLFELVAGADPYVTNIDPSQGNVFYLSQDLRVFTATPGMDATPVPGGPAFLSDDTAGAYDYVQRLLTWLNATYADPAGTDPFTAVLPDQGTALTSDSSVTPFTVDFSGFFPQIFTNYQFAIARVRLRGTAGPAGAASGVRTFFRLWSTETADTDYQPTSTYASDLDAAGLPSAPQVGAGHTTLPFFASGNLGANNDYGPGGTNTRDLVIAGGQDSVWAYFGCFLNLYDGSYVIDGRQIQGWLNGTHHCLVAQVAYDGAPVFDGATPEASDKLAQRNLQVTTSDNPGPASAHRVPQTFDVRPSQLGAVDGVDELMIDWGAIPAGSTASIYWPAVDATEVLDLASSLYRTHGLSVGADPHTIRCDVTGGVTYLPIPARAGENFAGLLTVDLPTTVRAGEDYEVVVRRLGHKADRIIYFRKDREHREGDHEEPATRAGATWRYVIGTFSVKIPVGTAETMLLPEENTLAILRWRLGQLPPGDRWYPVTKRHVDLVAGRVAGLGGDPDSIQPSPTGVPLPDTGRPGKGECDEDLVEHSGRVEEIVFDCHGRIEGFVIEGCCERHAYVTRDPDLAELILRARRDRFDLTVLSPRQRPREVVRIVVRA